MTQDSKHPDEGLLEVILARITDISDRLDFLTQSIERLNSTLHSIYPDVVTGVTGKIDSSNKSSLPSSIDLIRLQELRPGIFRTYKALQRFDGWVSSQELANLTKRSRGLESRYLTYLTRQGLVVKKRVKSKSDPRATEVLYRMVGVED